MKKKRKNLSLIMISAVILCLAGCGNTDRPVNAEIEENIEKDMLDSGMDVDEIVDRVEEIKDGDVATTDKPAEATASPEPTATVNPAPTETPQPTASPEPTATPTPEPTPTPHVHVWAETVTRAAGCAEVGEKTLTCSCGDSKTEAIPATGNHNWEEVYQTVTHPSTGHVEEVQVQVGTTAGYTVYSCAVCKAQFDTPSGVSDHCASMVGIDNRHAAANTIATDYPGEPIYETQSQWIVDSPEYTIQEIVGHTCSVCGATK